MSEREPIGVIGTGYVGLVTAAGFAELGSDVFCIDIDAAKMMEVLRIGQEKVRDKGLRSAVKRVDPMRSQTGMEREAILDVFYDSFKHKYDATDGEITADDLDAAADRCVTKFSTHEWTHRLP